VQRSILVKERSASLIYRIFLSLPASSILFPLQFARAARSIQSHGALAAAATAVGFTAAAASTDAQCAGGVVGSLSEISSKLSNIEAALGSAEPPTETFMFTSESVNEGHPDKLADQVSFNPRALF